MHHRIRILSQLADQHVGRPFRLLEAGEVLRHHDKFLSDIDNCENKAVTASDLQEGVMEANVLSNGYNAVYEYSEETQTGKRPIGRRKDKLSVVMK